MLSRASSRGKLAMLTVFLVWRDETPVRALVRCPPLAGSNPSGAENSLGITMSQLCGGDSQRKDHGYSLPNLLPKERENVAGIARSSPACVSSIAADLFSALRRPLERPIQR